MLNKRLLLLACFLWVGTVALAFTIPVHHAGTNCGTYMQNRPKGLDARERAGCHTALKHGLWLPGVGIALGELALIGSAAMGSKEIDAESPWSRPVPS